MGLFSGISKAIKGVTGALSGGGLVSSALGFLGQERANDQNMDIAQMNNETAIDLANTRYQRQVKDLNAAGLNPMLGYLKHDGGNVPQLQQAKVENSAASAAQSAMTNAQIENARAQTAQAESQAMLNSANAKKSEVEARATAATAGLSELDLSNKTKLNPNLLDTSLKEFDARSAKAVTDQLEQSIKWNSQHYLVELAKKLGYRSMDEANASQEFRAKLLDYAQRSLKNNELKSYSDMYGSDYGKNIAPYLNSAKDSVPFLNYLKK